MELEKYTKQTGAFLRPKYREVFSNSITETKGDRAISVEDVVVKVTLEDGNTHSFQGDEQSQNRLNRAFTVLSNVKDILTKKWKTSDNKWVYVTETDILNILTAAGLAQQELW